MGWNSYDCLGYSVTEAQVKEVADYMAEHLKQYGWEYVVVDWYWYAPLTGSQWPPNQNERFEPRMAMDSYGRLTPSLDRFPSAANSKGFRPLADYVHSKGLKFGIHLIRGVPQQAVAEKTPILGSKNTAADIAWIGSNMEGRNINWGILMEKPGAQEYLNSLLNLYAGWGVDFLKVDDILNKYYKAEIEGYRKAIDQCGREIVFSGSYGPPPFEEASHVSSHMNMWRLTGDLWPSWRHVNRAFEVIPKWFTYASPGHWPDADMLPLGKIMDIDERGRPFSSLNPEEQRTLMTLWCITRQPLILGGYLPANDAFVNSLITNPEVLEVDQRPAKCTVLSSGVFPIFVAAAPGSADQAVAFFNRSSEGPKELTIELKDLGMKRCRVRDLWLRKDLGEFTDSFRVTIAAHGTGMYRFTDMSMIQP